jgi:hypothetical protein
MEKRALQFSHQTRIMCMWPAILIVIRTPNLDPNEGSAPELAQRNAENLHKKLAEVNEAKKLVRRVPTQSGVSGWVDQAKKLTRALTY